MLITGETFSVNPRTGRVESVLRAGFGAEFEQSSPDWEELRAWVQDPAILSALGQDSINVESLSDLGLGFDVNKLPVLIGLRLQDWARAQESRLMPMIQQIGIVRGEDIGALTSTTHGIVTNLVDVMQTEPTVLTEDLAKRAVFDFYKMSSNLAAAFGGFSSNPYLALAKTVIDFTVQFADSISAMKHGDASAVDTRLPLVTPAGEVSDAGRVVSIRKAMSLGRDWTTFALPSTAGDWNLYEVGEMRPADLGFALARSNTSHGWTVGKGIGFMPGTARTQGILQFTSPWRSVRDHYEKRTIQGGRPAPPTANWGSHKCDPNTQEIGAFGAGCLQSPETFTGSVNCRQCIPIHSWTGGRGDWTERTNALSSEVVNVDDWQVNSTNSLQALFESFSVTNPSSWCINVEGVITSWYTFWRDFFDFIPSAWDQNDAYPWRALLSHFAAMGLVSREDGRIGGVGTMLDWRVRKWGEYDSGIVVGPRPGAPPIYSGMPTDPKVRAQLEAAGIKGPGLPDAVALRYIKPTPFLWENSIFERAIRPACEQLALTQLRGYQTTMVAYLWHDQGAHWDAAARRQRDNEFGHAYESGLRKLLDTPHLRSAVAMQHVVDPVVRQLLLDSGVSEKQAGGGVLAPDIATEKHKPIRLGANPIVTFADNWERPPGVPPPVGGYPGRAGAWPQRATVENDDDSNLMPWLLGAGALGALGMLLRRR